MHQLLLPHRKYSWYSFPIEAESTPGHSAAGRIMLMKNSIDTIGNQTHDLPTCSTMPQPTALWHAPLKYCNAFKTLGTSCPLIWCDIPLAPELSVRGYLHLMW